MDLKLKFRIRTRTDYGGRDGDQAEATLQLVDKNGDSNDILTISKPGSYGCGEYQESQLAEELQTRLAKALGKLMETT